MSFEAFTITFLVDEDLKVWEETFKWIVSLTRPESYSQYIKSINADASPYQDGLWLHQEAAGLQAGPEFCLT